MKTTIFKTLFTALVLTMSVFGLQAQSWTWTTGTNGLSLTPTNANVGLGTTATTNTKLSLYNSSTATSAIYGLNSSVENTASNSGAIYGAYLSAVRASYSTTSTNPLYGLYLFTYSLTGDGKTYGIYVQDNNGGTNNWAGYFGGRVAVTGNLGVGTDTPENTENWNKVAEVRGTNNSKFIVTTNSVTSGLWSHNTGIYGAPAGGVSGTHSNHNFSFITNKVSRMTISANGNVGIGNPSPNYNLDVAGNQRIKGRIAIHPDGCASDESYNGNVVITKPASSGQYINLIRQGQYPWSIGTIYNSSSFAIGNGKVTDSQFTNPFFIINTSGNVGIGTTTPTNKLEVNGTIRAKEVKLETTNWPDYVFSPDYQLPSLESVSKHIQENKHLPNIPSAQEVVENGINISEISAKLLQKIEELTLYVIEQNKAIESLQKKNNELEQKVNNWK